MDEMRKKLQALVGRYGNAPSESKPAPVGGLPGLFNGLGNLFKRFFR